MNPLRKYYISYLANPKQEVITEIHFESEEKLNSFGTALK